MATLRGRQDGRGEGRGAVVDPASAGPTATAAVVSVGVDDTPAGEAFAVHRPSALGRRPPLAVQLVKFGLVGVTNTLLTLVVYTLLFHELGVWYVLASAIGYSVGAVNGYLLNGRWTFRGHDGGRSAAARWVVVQGCGLGLNTALVYGFVDGAHVGKLAAQALAIAIVVLITFFANRRWTFPVRPVAAP